jgi:hypothetical protein
MHFSKEAVSTILSLFSRTAIAANVDSGYDVLSAAQVMINKASHS